MVDLEVLCVGSAALDTMCVVDRHPAADSRVVTDAVVTAGGGPAGTAAVAMARLGIRVGFCGVVGTDDAGNAVIDGLEAEGVDTRWVVRDPRGHTPRSVIIAATATQTRAIVTTSALTPLASHVPLDVAPIIHADQSGFGALSGVTPASGIRISVDAGNPVAGLDLSKVWLYAPSAPGLARDFPAATALDSAELARAAGASVVVATDGAAGSFWLDADGSVAFPGFSVPIVSTLGAGDVFHGALVAAIVRGLDPRDALRWANAAAALSCAAIDGRTAIPTATELEAFLDQIPNPATA